VTSALVYLQAPEDASARDRVLGLSDTADPKDTPSLAEVLSQLNAEPHDLARARATILDLLSAAQLQDARVSPCSRSCRNRTEEYGPSCVQNVAPRAHNA